MATTTLKREFDFFLNHQTELVKKYPGAFLVIHDGEVFGAFASALEAITSAKKKLRPGEFLIQRAEEGSEATTQSYFSGVAI